MSDQKEVQIVWGADGAGRYGAAVKAAPGHSRALVAVFRRKDNGRVHPQHMHAELTLADLDKLEAQIAVARRELTA